ncbi:MAG: 30S ribosomal protein S9 [Gemmatimonadota bacterium]|jgi:small subunit ribosomal protein S9|uniref:30S ribosomal protein S9 n=1 Tax=marine metagenome TaxID=408172 RepID=A0A382HLH2_9ZZZZ|nr:30S ribosomal protein S9 [Gemmatimonadota bacterium]
MAGKNVQAVGRRKTAVARVTLTPGKGEWAVNTRSLSEYFPRPTHQQRVEQPLREVELHDQFDVRVRVHGGGPTGQADAVRMGLARALVEHDEDLRSVMRSGGFLTRDSRKVERKKPGRPKARKRFQFSKR